MGTPRVCWFTVSGRCYAFNALQSHRLAPFCTLFRRCSSHSPNNFRDTSDPDLKQAREWLKNFSVFDIPRDRFEIRFSRSSGPGGQNVNKLNTKALIQCSWDAMTWIPPSILERLKQNHFRYLTKHNKVVVQDDTTRSSQGNLDECFKKLHSLIKECAFVPDEMSAETQEKWRAIEKKTNEARLKKKKFDSEKRKFRKSGGID
ncbi:uncharacterized protein V1518DRAFT_409154 [Limtongia smithiae]|uniref:uncharacterized protein n=1 Tax=Limtongia smithiae TaxID=1125753 RepID=UPI0034CF791F